MTKIILEAEPREDVKDHKNIIVGIKIITNGIIAEDKVCIYHDEFEASFDTIMNDLIRRLKVALKQARRQKWKT